MGHLCIPTNPPNSTLTNLYSKANVKCTQYYCGGLFGKITPGSKTSINISKAYSSSSVVPPGSYVGAVVGYFCYGAVVDFVSVFYNNQTTSLPGIGTGAGVGAPLGYLQGQTCSQLWNTVSGFGSPWTGDRLISEYNSSFGICSCTGGFNVSSLAPFNYTSLSMTQKPTTQTLPTNPPTTNLATSNSPTTSLPTTQKLTTQTPPTNPPTTQKPTTQTPPTNLPTTNLTTSNSPTTSLPTTQKPKTQTLQQQILQLSIHPLQVFRQLRSQIHKLLIIYRQFKHKQ